MHEEVERQGHRVSMVVDRTKDLVDECAFILIWSI